MVKEPRRGKGDRQLFHVGGDKRVVDQCSSSLWIRAARNKERTKRRRGSRDDKGSERTEKQPLCSDISNS